MSVVPSTTLPKCTRTAVIDLLFMRKYALSQTQMLVMYYLLMLKNWVKFIDDGYYVILSKKIENDLKLHPKTVEASLTQLKKLNLIETKRCKVAIWNEDKTYRGVAITTLGREYNLSYRKESEHQQLLELEIENENFRVENDAVHSENMELESKNSDLEQKNRSLNLQLESDEELNRASIKAIEKNRKLEERCLSLEIENRELKEHIEMNKSTKQTPKEEKEKNIENFRKKIVRQYAQSGKPICNSVTNSDSWATETQFYINGYSRLSIYLPNGKSKQIAEPKQINNFWEWMFHHQHRVGNLLSSDKIADISVLLTFIGALILLNQKPYRVKSLKPVVGGVKVTLVNSNGELTAIYNGHGSEVIDVQKCREWLELYARKDSV